MPFDKEYPNRKDWRKPYRGTINYDCGHIRSVPGCFWCGGSLRHKEVKLDLAAEDALKDYSLKHEMYLDALDQLDHSP